MKRNFFITTALICCVMVCFAAVASIDGNWAGSIKAPDGNEYPLNYNFKVDGDKLTGTAKSQQGEIQISEGKVNGDDFSFSFDVNGTKVLNTGKYYAAADSAGLDIDFGGYKMHLTLKRDTK